MTADDVMELAGGFAEASRADWLAEVEAALGGRSFDRLRTTTVDGLTIEPLYGADDVGPDLQLGYPGMAPYTRGADPLRSTWDIRPVVSLAATSNPSVIDGLERGATSILVDASSGAASDLGALLEGVHLDLAPVVLSAGWRTAELAAALVDLWEAGGVPPSARLGGLGFDPLGTLAADGALAGELDAELAVAADWVGRLGPDHPGVRVLEVDATPYAEAGAGAGDELAFSLATGVAYLRAMEAAGHGPEVTLPQIEFRFAATADQFLTIAKLRAARRVWWRVADACAVSGPAAAPRQHAVTAASMLTRRDPYLNLLRTTVACFAAGVGGADAITVSPFDAAIGRPGELGLRLARNIHLLLLEEAGVGRVTDPGGGSWYVESLTNQLAAAAWEGFQAIEARGGMADELRSGRARELVDRRWSERERRIATRRDPIVGVSVFADLDEPRVAREEQPARVEPVEPATRVDPLPRRADADGFELRRRVAEDAAAPPAVFLANLGPIAAHTARASWVTQLLEAGGVRAMASDGFDDADAVSAAFGASGTSVAVICGSDDDYATLAAPTARGLRAAGATRVVLAGAPGDHEDEWRTAGIDAFVHIGVDVLAALDDIHAALGVGR